MGSWEPETFRLSRPLYVGGGDVGNTEVVAGGVHQLVDPGHVEGERLDVDEGTPDVAEDFYG